MITKTLAIIMVSCSLSISCSQRLTKPVASVFKSAQTVRYFTSSNRPSFQQKPSFFNANNIKNFAEGVFALGTGCGTGYLLSKSRD